MPLRVVLDSNCFHPGTFELLESSPMRALCSRRKVVAIYSDQLLKEVVYTYGRGERRELLLRQWAPFMRDTCGELVDDLATVWHSELIRNLMHRANPNLSPKDACTAFVNIEQAPPDGTWDLWEEAKLHLEKARLANDDIHAILRDERVTQTAERDNSALIVSGAGAAHLTGPFERLVDSWGRCVIKKHLKTRKPEEVAARWSAAKERYPYFTESMRGLVYVGLEPTAIPNARLDRNAVDDIKIMAPLLSADVVVSNETNFLLRAFNALWRPRRKVLMTVEQFAKHLHKMA